MEFRHARRRWADTERFRRAAEIRRTTEAKEAQEAKETQEARHQRKEERQEAQEGIGQDSAATGQGCWITQEQQRRSQRQR